MAQNNPLPFFPVPYPGENLYSLFARYHERSGNLKSVYTARDLFGGSHSFYSSLATPYLLKFFNGWYPEGTGITAEKLLLEHTVFQYYCLGEYQFRRDHCLKEIRTPCEKKSAYREFVHMSRGTADRFRYLRYCPICAEEEKRLYGECYWHLLPQMNCIDFCPVHECRLLDTPISRTYAGMHFVSASNIWEKESRTSRVCFADRSNPADMERLLFAKDVRWILCHGADIPLQTAKACLDKAVRKETGYAEKSTSYMDKINSRVGIYLQVTENITPSWLGELISMHGHPMQTVPPRKREPLLTHEDKIIWWAYYSGYIPMTVLIIEFLFGNVESFCVQLKRHAGDCNN